MAVALVLASLVTVPAQQAEADTVPIASGEPASVSTDALPTAQIDGVVWAQTVVGNTVFVGGNFSRARPAGSPAGSNTVVRSNLLSYNITTGSLLAFAPDLNEQVKGLAASPDGKRLYVVGEFTTVNGVERKKIAAFDVATGALVPGFNPGANYRVSAVVASNSTVWVTGAFTSVGGQQRLSAAAFSATNGAVLPWAPELRGDSGGDQTRGDGLAIALSPAQDKVVIGGNFTSLNGSSSQSGYGIGMVPSTGTAKSNLTFRAGSVVRNGGVNAAINSLIGDSTGVYGSGFVFGAGGNLEGAFRASWDDGTILWLEDCHGDTYSVFPEAGLAYMAGHPHHCGNVGGYPEVVPKVERRALAFTVAATGTVQRNSTGTTKYFNFEGNPAPTQINWFPDFNTGTASGAGQGPWSVSGDGRYIVYGGEFTKVNNVAQQGLVRFAVKTLAPNKDGPRLSSSTFTPTASSRTPGSITLTWPANYDRDNEMLTYLVYRDGVQVRDFKAPSRVWQRPVLSYVDTGLTPGKSYTYSLRAVDPYGNKAFGGSVTATAGAGTPFTGYSRAVLEDNPRHYWRMGETSGATASDSAAGASLTLSTGVTRNVPGAIAGDSNRATRFDGASSTFGSTSTSEIAPKTFSVEVWFKTASTSGGKIVGFGNKMASPSSQVDRHLYLDANGRVNFGVYSSGNKIVQSAVGFNDNQWHHVVGALSSGGMRLYIDGTLVAQSDTTLARQPASGYWRVGGDSSWSADGYLAGDIDEVAVYLSALSPSRVASHFALGSGQSAANSAVTVPDLPPQPSPSSPSPSPLSPSPLSPSPLSSPLPSPLSPSPSRSPSPLPSPSPADGASSTDDSAGHGHVADDHPGEGVGRPSD